MEPGVKQLPTLVGLATAMAGPILLAGAGQRFVGHPASVAAQVGGQLMLWAIAAAVLAIVVVWEHRPLASIGFAEVGWKSVASGLAMAAALMYAIAPFALKVVAATGLPGFEARFAAQLGGMPRWFLVFAAVSGGTIEELLYRGYAVERIAALTSSYWASGAIVVTIFAAAHIPVWGIGPALTTVITGSALTGFYIWRRDVVANMIAHVVTDTAGLLALAAAVRPH